MTRTAASCLAAACCSLLACTTVGRASPPAREQCLALRRSEPVDPSPIVEAPPRPLPRGVLLRYDVRGCHGNCPVFRVVVHEDGRLRWYGRRHVRARGHRLARLTPQALAALRAWLACLAPMRATSPYFHDLPRRLQFRLGDAAYFFTIDWDMNRGSVRVLQQIDRILELDRWTM